jgi:hypothetical protein
MMGIMVIMLQVPRYVPRCQSLGDGFAYPSLPPPLLYPTLSFLLFHLTILEA